MSAAKKKKVAPVKRRYETPAKKPAKPKLKADSEGTLDEKLARYLSFDNEINALLAQVSALKKEQEVAETILLESLQRQGLESIKNSEASVHINKRVVVGIEDFTKFMAYVFKHKATDLVQRRVTQQAVKDREDNGESIPGLKKTTLVGLSLTRTKAK